MPEQQTPIRKYRYALLAAGGVLVAYLLFKPKKSAEPATGLTLQELAQLQAAQGFGSAARNADNLTSALDSLGATMEQQLGQLGGLFSTGFAGLATGIHGDITGAVTAVSNKVQAAQTAIGDQITAQNAAVANINTQVGNIAQGIPGITGGITALQSAISDGVNSLSALINGIVDKIEGKIKPSLDAMGSNINKVTDAQAWLAGSQSVAICLRPDGTVDATCTKTHSADLPTAGFPAGDVSALVKSKYPTCIAGNNVDIRCVGKQILGVAP